MSEYTLFFLGIAQNRVGRSIVVRAATDAEAMEQAAELGKFFDGAEVWKGGRLICHMPIVRGCAQQTSYSQSSGIASSYRAARAQANDVPATVTLSRSSG